MAIVRTAGTEIIRTAYFEEVANTDQKIIIGEQHHIYTVLSIVLMSITYTAGSVYIYFKGYDAKGSSSNRTIFLNKWVPSAADQTFVWNDKFSFNGTEPTDRTGAMDGADDQNALADQAQTTSQSLIIDTSASGLTVNCGVTFIDQNNA